MQDRGGAAASARRDGTHLAFSDCSRVRVVHGRAVVYFSPNDVRAGRGQAVSAGMTIQVPAAQANAKADPVWRRMVTAFLSLARTQETEEERKSRNTRDEALRMLPFGRILPTTAPMVIALPQTAEFRVARVSIALAAGTRATVLAVEPAAGVLRIPADALSPGLDYVWSADTNAGPVIGAFSVLSRREAATIEDRYASTGPTDGIGPLQHALYLESQDLQFEAEQLIREMVGDSRR